MNDEWAGLPGESASPRPMPAWIPKTLAWSALGMVLSLGLCGASYMAGDHAETSGFWELPAWAGLIGFFASLLALLLSGALVMVYLFLGRR